MELHLFFIASVPIVWLMISLGVFKMKSHITCGVTLITTFILAIMFWKMPVIDAVTAIGEGAALAIWPIIWVIIAAVFTYNVSMKTGSMEIIKTILTNLTTDKRILVLILAWGFGGFLESIAGFGTAVAIPASIMATVGFNPLFAAIICLVANTVATAFGAIGTPVNTLAKITNLDVTTLSYFISLQLVIFIILIPFLLVFITDRKFKSVIEVAPVALLSGLGFAIPQVFIAKSLGAELPALIGSVCSITLTIIGTKVFMKKQNNDNTEITHQHISIKQGLIACSSFILVFIFILLTSPLIPAIYIPLSKIATDVSIYTGEGAKAYRFIWIGTPGTMIILATFIGGLIQKSTIKEMLVIFKNTVIQMRYSALTIVFIVSLAKILGYSGMINSIANVLVLVTGSFYPLFAPIIGALGTFVTGSDTSANVLFGNLQVEVAKKLSMNPYWLAAANTAGATAGKMISPQSIAVATAATGLLGQEGKILNTTLKFCFVYVLVLGVLVYLGAPLVANL